MHSWHFKNNILSRMLLHDTWIVVYVSYLLNCELLEYRANTMLQALYSEPANCYEKAEGTKPNKPIETTEEPRL